MPGPRGISQFPNPPGSRGGSSCRRGGSPRAPHRHSRRAKQEGRGAHPVCLASGLQSAAVQGPSRQSGKAGVAVSGGRGTCLHNPQDSSACHQGALSTMSETPSWGVHGECCRSPPLPPSRYDTNSPAPTLGLRPDMPTIPPGLQDTAQHWTQPGQPQPFYRLRKKLILGSDVSL